MLAIAAASFGTVPAAPLFFNQTIDHFAATPSSKATSFAQRYYLNTSAFGGPGHPLLVIIGGEGAIPPSTGFFYPWVVDILAPHFKALVLQPEHRFYGVSAPKDPFDLTMLRHLTPQQALADTVALIRHIQAAHRCAPSRGPGYCPVITIGGSYPGWLSAMMRLRYPYVVDGAYAASGPFRIYSQHVDQYAYYRVVTRTAEKARSGCSAAVRSHLSFVINASSSTLVSKLGLCTPLPTYMARGGDATLRAEVLMLYRVAFAGLDMAFYPPGRATSLARACALFVDATPGADPWTALKAFLATHGSARFIAGRGLVHVGHGVTADADAGSAGPCFNLSLTLPATGYGGEGTISCGDWSGCGSSYNGLSCAPAPTPSPPRPPRPPHQVPSPSPNSSPNSSLTPTLHCLPPTPWPPLPASSSLPTSRRP